MATIHRQRHICARVSPGVRAALEAEAAKSGGDLSAIVRDAVIDWLEARAVERISNSENAES
jgi:hypothetical protein